MAYLISFCIPTYNFGQFIGQTLRNIIEQADDSIQIVIVDGASNDNTAEIVTSFKKKFAHIKFIQREKNVGVDLDILESVNQADGEYCWLFSSDDLITPGAVKKVRSAIDAGNWDVHLTGMTCCDVDMKPLWNHPIISSPIAKTYDWNSPEQRVSYFSNASTSTAFFSFISDIVVKRQKWIETPTETRFIGSCWIIAAKLFALSQSGMRVRFDPDIYLLKRGDNDSFASRGLLRRAEIGIKAFREVAWYFFGRDSMESAHVSRVLKNEYPLLVMLHFKRQIHAQKDPEQIVGFDKLAALHFGDGTIKDKVYLFTVRVVPIWLLTVLANGFIAVQNLVKFVKR